MSEANVIRSFRLVILTCGVNGKFKMLRKHCRKNAKAPRIYQTFLATVAYLWGGGGLPLPPFQPTIIFYDGIFGCFTNFFLLKHQNLGIQ